MDIINFFENLVDVAYDKAKLRKVFDQCPEEIRKALISQDSSIFDPDSRFIKSLAPHSVYLAHR